MRRERRRKEERRRRRMKGDVDGGVGAKKQVGPKIGHDRVPHFLGRSETRVVETGLGGTRAAGRERDINGMI
jgi:hypothetical protein